MDEPVCMTGPGGESVLTLVLWHHEDVPVVRLRGAPSPSESVDVARTVKGRDAVLRAVDEWLTSSRAAQEHTETGTQRDAP